MNPKREGGNDIAGRLHSGDKCFGMRKWERKWGESDNEGVEKKRKGTRKYDPKGSINSKYRKKRKERPPTSSEEGKREESEQGV